MVKNYEYTYLTRQDMSEEAAKELQDKIAQLVQAKLGTIIDTPRSYKKRLAYKIKKQETAYINTVMFTLDTEKLEFFKKETDVMTEILRGLIVSYDPKKLEREARREPRSSEDRNQETPVVAIKETPAKPVAVTEVKTVVEKKIEKPQPVKEEKEEEKEEKKEEEAKEIKKVAKKEDKPKEKEEKAAEEKVAEEKAAKPKRRTKIKTELKDIEQKLDEILK